MKEEILDDDKELIVSAKCTCYTIALLYTVCFGGLGWLLIDKIVSWLIIYILIYLLFIVYILRRRDDRIFVNENGIGYSSDMKEKEGDVDYVAWDGMRLSFDWCWSRGFLGPFKSWGNHTHTLQAKIIAQTHEDMLVIPSFMWVQIFLERKRINHIAGERVVSCSRFLCSLLISVCKILGAYLAILVPVLLVYGVFGNSLYSALFIIPFIFLWYWIFCKKLPIPSDD